MGLGMEEFGARAHVICLHGWTSDHEVFVESAKALSDKAHFVLYVHRGHASNKDANAEPVSVETLADDLNEVIEGLGLDEVTLLGWSMGTDVALAYVDTHGCSRLKQLVICDMTPRKMNDESWNLGLFKGGFTKCDAIADRDKDFETLFYDHATQTDPRLALAPKERLMVGIRRQVERFDESVALSLYNSMNEGDWRESVAG